MATSQYLFGDIAPRLLANGYTDILPAVAGTKKVVEPGWQNGYDEAQIKKFASNGYAGGNTGMLSRDVIGFDGDIRNKELAKLVYEELCFFLGKNPVRVGLAPKWLMVFRLKGERFTKFKVRLVSGATEEVHTIELLADGQQYIINGLHPDTQADYRWPHGSLLDVPKDQLIEASKEDFIGFFKYLEGALPSEWTMLWEGEGSGLVSGGGRALKDPREKSGLVGAFCRAFSVETIIDELIEGEFSFEGRSDTRLTWHSSDSGLAGGAVVLGEARCHVFNQHNSDPCDNHAVNLFDLVRCHKFGSLDTQAVKADTFDVTALPSYQAMVAWASSLPEVQAELPKGDLIRGAAAAEAGANHKDALTAAVTEEALREIAVRIAGDTSLDPLGKELLAGLLGQRIHAVTGVKPRAEVVRGLLEGRRAVAHGAEEAPWLERWVYVTDQDKFFNLSTKEKTSRAGFDAKFNRELGVDGESAASAAIDRLGIPVVARLLYIPWLGDLFNMDGLDVGNLYRVESVPVAAKALTDDEKAMVAVLDKHLEVSIPNKTYRKKLKQWMAHQARYPGVKVLWAPCIRGIEGDGKTVIGQMLQSAMGAENVGVVSNTTLSESSFTGWAMGKAVNIIEEILLAGHNRFDAANKLKPLITNPRIEIHPKGREPFTTLNTCNYLIFTNHKGALPLEDTDRRYMVLFLPWQTIEEFHKAIGGDAAGYWDALYKVLETRPDLVRGWLDDVDLSDFNQFGRAPDTEFKTTMVMLSAGDDVIEIQNVIEAGGIGFNSEIISSADLSKALQRAGVEVKTMAFHRALDKLKFHPVAGTLKWEKKNRRVWTKEAGPFPTWKLREMLDRTTFDADLLG